MKTDLVLTHLVLRLLSDGVLIRHNDRFGDDLRLRDHLGLLFVVYLALVWD